MPEFHLPRLSRYGVRTLIADMDALLELDWRDRRRQAERWTSHGQLGARNASDAELETLRAALVDAATTAGLSQGEAGKRRFDTECANLFSNPDCIPLTEGLRDDVWAWLATVLCPELVRARFGQSENRYQGGVRNTFQRLWTRGAAFRSDRIEEQERLIRQMTEDAQVQIFERPGLSANIRTARLIAEHWVDLFETRGSSDLEEITRRVMVGLGVSNQIVALDTLEDDALKQEISRLFDLAVRAVDA